jgi:hypothetical protein
MKLGHSYILITIFLALTFSVEQMAAQSSSVNGSSIEVGAKQYGSSIRVNWKSGSESESVSYYAVYRSSTEGGPYTTCIQSYIAWTSNKEYLIDDNSDLFKTSGKLFYYKVEAVDASGKVITSGVAITLYNSTSSTAKRTWGSIKAMFR